MDDEQKINDELSANSIVGSRLPTNPNSILGIWKFLEKE